MTKQASLPVIFGFVIFFSILFHNNPLGINLLIFEMGIIGYLYFSGQVNFKTLNLNILFAAQIITCLSTIVIHSALGYLVHYLISMVFIGVVISPSVKSLLNSFLLSLGSFFNSQKTFLNDVRQISIGNRNPASILLNSRFYIIPALIIFLFITLYNFSNPKFNALTADFTSGIFNFINELFAEYDLTILFTMFIGLLISNYFLIRTPEDSVIDNDTRSSDALANPGRIQSEQGEFKPVRNEMRSAVLMLTILNVILLVVNCIDINWVWFNFEWEGQYLKQFVHEGTWLLIISILFSIAIVLYYFRGGLNFEENKILKYLCYSWLFQNAILAVSVAIRNLYYIDHFNLAYKRIGVLIFLILTVYGLFSVWMKVRNKYSVFYLFRTNFNALLLVLIISSMVNWDTFIAKYNFEHSENAFVHFNFLAGLSNKSLPYLDKTITELKKIETVQKNKFPREKFYMTPGAYHDLIQKRKLRFRNSWEAKGWLSWNLPEQLAYNKLFSNKEQ